MTNIAIVVGSTRPGRFGPQVARWFLELAQTHTEAKFEIVDIAEYQLPVYDEVSPGSVTKEHTEKWNNKIDEFDGYIFVTAEHNHTYPASLKNAFDFLNQDWNNRPVAYVGYGFAAGHRAIEALRPLASQFKHFDIKEQVNIQLDGTGKFASTDSHNKHAEALVESIIFWADIFKSAREKLS